MWKLSFAQHIIASNIIDEAYIEDPDHDLNHFSGLLENPSAPFAERGCCAIGGGRRLRVLREEAAGDALLGSELLRRVH